MMMLRDVLRLAVLALLLSACSIQQPGESGIPDLTGYVNPMIGTGGHGHTFPGVAVPHGMVQLSPDTRTLGWDACGGYHHTDSTIIGFSHTHISGTGIGDYGDLLFTPIAAEEVKGELLEQLLGSSWSTGFSHENEKASPGYYAVNLHEQDIDVELTATTRCGFHRYDFPSAGAKTVVIDLYHDIYKQGQRENRINIINDREISGLKRTHGWAFDQHLYFHIVFDQPFEYKLYSEGALVEGAMASSGNTKVLLSFNGDGGTEVKAKVGISAVDEAGAKANLESEISHWDFNRVLSETEETWNSELGKIKVETGDEELLTIFYTSMYHASMVPYTFSDVDGRYRGMDYQVHQSDRTMYTIYSLWDTYRAFHPYKVLVDPDLNNDFIHSLLIKYKEGGILPKWEHTGNYTGTMIGYHGVSVIADAVMKGETGFDMELAYEAMKRSATYDTTGIVSLIEPIKRAVVPMAKHYNETLGFIPFDLENESVSKALEYAYNDWCIAQVAGALGHEEDRDLYLKRSGHYKRYYDKTTGFMRGVNRDGSWKTPFDPRYSEHQNDAYTEGNAYQWSWYVPHDVPGLMELMGGREPFIAGLDTLFATNAVLEGEHASRDISGFIGQYAHGNEPSHHILHLYNYAGQPWRTQELADSVMHSLYLNSPDGISGNEDVGQMSAWYILNAIGIYPVCPGETRYSIGRPLFDRATVQLPHGETLEVLAKNNSRQNRYVQSVSLNGEALQEPFISHSDLLAGGRLAFEMGPEPNRSWGVK
ncbi:MAG: GH92 family glycosyl hydrolase [Bacteroidota bacterium]